MCVPLALELPVIARDAEVGHEAISRLLLRPLSGHTNWSRPCH